MDQALYSGISGLLSNQYALNVTSNNIANIDTNGFRGSSAEFQNLFEQSLASTYGNGPVNSTVGTGASISTTALSTTDGSLTTTGNPLDLAINGNGWFGVENNGNTYYTRDGSFQFDSGGNLVNANGDLVLGTAAKNFNAQGVLTDTANSDTPLNASDAQTSITLPENLTYPPTPTTEATFSGNLGTSDTTQNASTQVIDAQGDKNTLQLTFTKSNPQPTTGISWDVTATVNTLASSTQPSQTLTTQNGILTFDADGALTSSTLSSIDNNGSAVQINVGSGFSGIISNASAQSAQALTSSSDGQVGGNLTDYSIDQGGNIMASFTNAKQVSMGKIALYHFQNEQGLQSAGGSNYAASNNSGKAFFYQDKNGQNILGASLESRKIEGSNVNISTALTQLIVLQRSYQANSKSISTGEHLIQQALQMST